MLTVNGLYNRQLAIPVIDGSLRRRLRTILPIELNCGMDVWWS